MSAAIDLNDYSNYRVSGTIISLEEARARKQSLRALQEASATQNFLRGVYQLCAQQRPRVALKLIFDTIDRWMTEGRWATVNGVLPDIELEKLAPTCVLGFLTITAPAKEKLLGRTAYYQRAKEHLRDELKELQAQDLFRSLE
jgi:hypothetical protein